jgi:hypothetical protein
VAGVEEELRGLRRPPVSAEAGGDTPERFCTFLAVPFLLDFSIRIPRVFLLAI